MTGKRILLGLVAASVCLVFGQTAERSETRVVQNKKKSAIGVTSLRTATEKSSAEQKPVSVSKEEYAEAGRGQVSRQPVAAPKDDNNSTVPKKTEKRPDVVSRREDNTETRDKSVNRQPESAPREDDDARSGAWWTRKQADPEPPTSVRVRTDPPEPKNDLRAPTAKSMPEQEQRRGSGGGGTGYGRGEPGRGRREWHGPHGGWYGRYRDYDYWRYGRRHRHPRFTWHLNWWFGPVVYYPVVYSPSVVYVPDVVRSERDYSGVFVRVTGDDALGPRFASELRAQLRQEGLRVTYSENDAALELYLVSMDADPDNAGKASAISVSYIWNPGNRFITAQLVDVGREQVADLAGDVAGYAADVYYEYR